MKKLNTKYADLMRQAQKAIGRKEAVGLLHKAAKLKAKFDSYEMMQFDINKGFDIVFKEEGWDQLNLGQLKEQIKIY